MMKSKKLLKLAAIGLALTTILAGCGSGKAASGTDTVIQTLQKVKVAYDQASKPMSWLDEKGNPTGYDVEVMKLVDELLPEYEFEYIGTTSDDLLSVLNKVNIK